MGKRTGNPVGRPPKPQAEKVVARLLSFPPDVWSELERRVPKGDRSSYVTDLVRRDLGLPARSERE